jgi:hypothetical protein
MQPPKPGNSFVLKVTAVASVTFLVSSIFLTLKAVESSLWFSFNNDSGDYKMKLLACDDCPTAMSSWTTDCFVATGCEADSGSVLCKQWSKANSAGTVVYYMDYLSLLCTILLTERLVFSLLSRYVGSKVVSYSLASVSASLQTVSVIQWFAVTGASFNGSCSDQGKDMNLCAEQGSILGICAAIVNLIGCLGGALYTKYYSAPDDLQFTIEGRRTFILTKVMPVLLIGLFFDIFGMSWQWTYYSDNNKQHSFITYAEQYDDFHHFGLNCIASAACDAPFRTLATQRECKAFDRLYEAGEVLRKMKLGEFLFALLWAEGASYLCVNKEYGVSMTQYLWPVLFILVQVVALITWSVKSGSAFTNSCNVVATDTDISFCSDTSVIFGIISIIVNVIAFTFFAVSFANRYDFKIRVEDSGKLPIKSPSAKQNQVTLSVAVDSHFDRSSSLLIGLDDSTQGPDSRAGTAMIKSRFQSPSILSKEPDSPTKVVRAEESCSLCYKR